MTAPAWWPYGVVGLAMAVAALHCWAVWDRYAVGSFDDDANYILTARALLGGSGLTGHLVSGDAVVAGYPPGFPLLLVPFEWASRNSFLTLRLASSATYLGLMPLTWHVLGRRAYPRLVRTAVLALMALNPVLATFSVMVMAEMPFLVCSLLLLAAVTRWERGHRLVTPTGLAVVLLAGGSVWLKEAGVGLVAGVVIWLLLRRQVRRAAVVAAALVGELVPVVVARVIDHIPLAGARYSSELGGYYGGGLLDRLVHVLPSAAAQYVSTALPRSVIPFGDPLPMSSGWLTVYDVAGGVISALVGVGLVVAIARYRDVGVVAVPFYVVETLFWPEINERRVVLVLPILLAWFVLGLWSVGWLAAAGAARLMAYRRAVAGRPAALSIPGGGYALRGVAVAVAVAAIGVPLALQLPRDYLFGYGRDSSQPQGSRYMAILRSIGAPTDVVETDYRYTTALFSGHRTSWNAFQEATRTGCETASLPGLLAADHAGYVLVGALNKPDRIDNPCYLRWATATPATAVRLLRTDRDLASVFELVGPGTTHPDVRDLTLGARETGSDGLADVAVAPAAASDDAGSALQTNAERGRGRISWTFSGAHVVSQVSVGEAGLVHGLARGVGLQILRPGGQWETVAYSTSAVGDGTGRAPFLLATLPAGTLALGVRVVIHGQGPVVALDVHALGSPARSRT